MSGCSEIENEGKSKKWPSEPATDKSRLRTSSAPSTAVLGVEGIIAIVYQS